MIISAKYSLFSSLTGSYSAINLLIDGKGLIIHYILNILKSVCSFVKKLNMEQAPHCGHMMKIGLCQVLWLPFVNGVGGWNEATHIGWAAAWWIRAGLSRQDLMIDKQIGYEVLPATLTHSPGAARQRLRNTKETEHADQWGRERMRSWRRMAKCGE